METPTVVHTDHHEARPPGACQCTAGSFCPQCMGRLQRIRQQWVLKRWLAEWAQPQRPAAGSGCGRPALRLVR